MAPPQPPAAACRSKSAPSKSARVVLNSPVWPDSRFPEIGVKVMNRVHDTPAMSGEFKVK
uniref:Uncharacterized protein n=1 Tax=Oryza glumipatula TaxID=40148 RepID=A0A0E0A1K4_9ORYZ